MIGRGTKWLFVHQSFAAQFYLIARHLAEQGHEVAAISQLASPGIERVRHQRYRRPRLGAQLHPLVRSFAGGIRNAEAVAQAADTLKRDGFVPDLMVGHTSWGEILCLKDVWPDRPLLGFFEWYPRSIPFDPEFPIPDDDPAYCRSRTALNLMSFEAADHGQTATEYQRSTFPKRFQDRITTVHDGIDTDAYRPNREARVRLGDHLTLVPGDEVVTYCSRGLEPYRGFHIFMRALPSILRRRPNAHVLIVGSGRRSYSPAPQSANTYAQQLMAEIGGSIDRSRVHFFGYLPPEALRAVLHISAAHVYLTRPFVMSWSLLEAMASGCLVIGSRTPPVEEVIDHGKSGLLVDFFDVEGLADRVCEGLAFPERWRSVRAAARETVVDRYDFKTRCLAGHLSLYGKLIGTRLPVK